MRLVRETDPLPRLLGVSLLATAAAAWPLLRAHGAALLGASRCPLRELTGLPCPTCGGAHAAVALARGDVAGALHASPLVTLAAALAGAWGVAALAATLAPGWRRRLALDARERRAARLLALLLLLAGWAWQVAGR